MGAWGSGIFENDTAADFGASVAEGGGVAALESALDAVLGCGGYLEAPQAEEALAAAEILTRMKGNGLPASAYTELVDAWIARTPTAPPAALLGKARGAVARILREPSELVELWHESDEFTAWQASAEDLTRRL